MLIAWALNFVWDCFYPWIGLLSLFPGTIFNITFGVFLTVDVSDISVALMKTSPSKFTPLLTFGG